MKQAAIFVMAFFLATLACGAAWAADKAKPAPTLTDYERAEYRLLVLKDYQQSILDDINAQLVRVRDAKAAFIKASAKGQEGGKEGKKAVKADTKQAEQAKP